MQNVPFSLLISSITITKVARLEFQTNRTLKTNSLGKAIYQFSVGHPLLESVPTIH